MGEILLLAEGNGSMDDDVCGRVLYVNAAEKAGATRESTFTAKMFDKVSSFQLLGVVVKHQ